MATVQAGLSQGGQHALAAELLLFIAIVGVRAIATYGPAPTVGGKPQKKTLPPDQYGPLFILGNGFVVFFLLALISARGGTAAKLAAAFGLTVDVALLLKSIPHIQQVALAYDSPHAFTPVSLTATTPAEEAPPPFNAKQLASLSSPGGKLSGPGGSPGAKGGGSGGSAGPGTAGAMAFAHRNLTKFGLNPADWPDLVKLWNQESGWRTGAVNPSSGATGIPQLNPNSHKVPAGWNGPNAAAIQIAWGLHYIKSTYGSIASAWAHEQHVGWY